MVSTQRAAVVLFVLPLLGFSVGGAVLRTLETQRRSRSMAELREQVPRPDLGDEFVSSNTCAACHPGEFHSWHRTYHRTMTQTARPDTVVGAFDGTILRYHDRDIRLERRGDEFWSHEGAASRRIVMTTGLHHYQVYWTESQTRGWLENFPLVYLREDARWVPRNDAFLMPPEVSRRPETPRTWNSTCIQCHSTHGEPRIDTEARTIDTEVAELGIACEACHGPAANHVSANRDPRRRYALHAEDGDGTRDTTIVNPAHLSHRRSAEVCGQCHSVFREKSRLRWSREGFAYRAGATLADTRRIVRHASRLPSPPSEEDKRSYAVVPEPEKYFWPDGMIRISGREYNGLIETPCFQRGTMSCLSCHSMHESDPNDQLANGMDSDEACLQCHESFRGQIEAHTHHDADSTGSRCYNCHMPHTTYGLLKAIRSHEVDSPSVATSRRSGRPLACNLCHLDRTLEWSQNHMREWYEHTDDELTEDERSTAASLLWLLRGEAGLRAITAWHFGWPPAQEASGSDWQAPFLAELLDDPYSAVRYLTYRALRTLPGYATFDYDYIGSDAERTAARQRAREQGTGGAPDERPGRNAAILREEDGSIRWDAVERLRRQRDDRAVDLLE